MSTYKELIKEQDKLYTEQKRIKEKIKEIDKHLDILEGSVLKVGQRVRLKRDWNTVENQAKLSGWKVYLHFMNPSNIATIREVEVDSCGRLAYTITFDNQDCRFSNYTESPFGYRTDSLFYFRESELEAVDEPCRTYKYHEQTDNEFDVAHKELRFATTAYIEDDMYYVRYERPNSYFAGGRQYIYQPLTKEQFEQTYRRID